MRSAQTQFSNFHLDIPATGFSGADPRLKKPAPLVLERASSMLAESAQGNPATQLLKKYASSSRKIRDA